jgi:fermentation-respiration switch protein FrsA (DUF1100 family)
LNDETSNPLDTDSSPATPARTRSKSWPRRILRILVGLAVIYVVWCATLYLIQDQIVFPASLAPPPRSEVPYPNATVLTLDIGPGEQVHAWFIPAPGCDAEHPAPVVVYFHGNVEIIDYLEAFVGGYPQLGCSLLLPEYRGYGRCGGRPSRTGIRADCIRFYDLLVERDDVDASRIIYHGRSLGGGIAADLAAHREPAAMILHSTFTSAEAMAHRLLGPAFLLTHRYRTDEVVASLDIPLLIFHGTKDQVIPVTHGRKLRDLARNGTYVEYACGHTDLPPSGQEAAYWNEIESFLRRCDVIGLPGD